MRWNRFHRAHLDMSRTTGYVGYSYRRFDMTGIECLIQRVVRTVKPFLGSV